MIYSKYPPWGDKEEIPVKQCEQKAVLFAILAAAFYALNAPCSKLLLAHVGPTMMAGLLYLGAGIGMAAAGKLHGTGRELPLTRAELPYAVGMVLLDIAAPVFLMFGLAYTTAANVSLLNNFEIVATSVIAFICFREAVTRRLWLAIALVTLSSVILSVEDSSSFSFSTGSLFVLAACICWGFENNCTRRMSQKDAGQIVVIKGLCSGCGSLLLALAAGETLPQPEYIALTMLLGFVAYGLSIFFYVRAQRELGAAKTSAYYAIAPFLGTGLSLLLFRQLPTVSFVIALAIMAAGTYFASTESKPKQMQPR